MCVELCVGEMHSPIVAKEAARVECEKMKKKKGSALLCGHLLLIKQREKEDEEKKQIHNC